MTATELLKNDHQKAISLIGELEDADRQVGTVQTNTDAFNHLNELLMMHTLIEEEVFYPAMKKFDESRDLARSMRKGHKEFERLLSHLSTMAPNVGSFRRRSQTCAIASSVTSTKRRTNSSHWPKSCASRSDCRKWAAECRR
jgi:hemerythrin superfamily protein